MDRPLSAAERRKKLLELLKLCDEKDAKRAMLIIERARDNHQSDVARGEERKRRASAAKRLGKTLDRLERQVRDAKGLWVTGGDPAIDDADRMAEDVKRLRKWVAGLVAIEEQVRGNRPGPKLGPPDSEIAVGILARLWCEFRPDEKLSASDRSLFSHFVSTALKVKDSRRIIRSAKRLGLLKMAQS